MFLQDLARGQESVTSFNELSNQLLQEYAADDTRKVKEVMDKLNTAWNSVNNRYTHAHVHFINLRDPRGKIHLDDVNHIHTLSETTVHVINIPVLWCYALSQIMR